jgi:hypothetical protein
MTEEAMEAPLRLLGEYGSEWIIPAKKMKLITV